MPGKVFNLEILSCTGWLDKNHISISVSFRAKHCTIIIHFVCFFKIKKVRKRVNLIIPIIINMIRSVFMYIMCYV